MTSCCLFAPCLELFKVIPFFFPFAMAGVDGVPGLHPWAACTHGQSSGHAHVPYVFFVIIHYHGGRNHHADITLARHDGYALGYHACTEMSCLFRQLKPRAHDSSTVASNSSWRPLQSSTAAVTMAKLLCFSGPLESFALVRCMVEDGSVEV